MAGTESYSRSNEDRQTERIEKARYEKIESELKELREEAAKAKAEKVQAERYSKLSDLQHEGFNLDPKEEVDFTKDFTDEQFETYLDRIPKRYSRIPLENVVPRLHTPDLESPKQRADDEKKQKYSRRAIEIATAAANAGKTISAAEAFELALKESNAVA